MFDITFMPYNECTNTIYIINRCIDSILFQGAKAILIDII